MARGSPLERTADPVTPGSCRARLIRSGRSPEPSGPQESLPHVGEVRIRVRQRPQRGLHVWTSPIFTFGCISRSSGLLDGTGRPLTRTLPVDERDEITCCRVALETGRDEGGACAVAPTRSARARRRRVIGASPAALRRSSSSSRWAKADRRTVATSRAGRALPSRCRERSAPEGAARPPRGHRARRARGRPPHSLQVLTGTVAVHSALAKSAWPAGKPLITPRTGRSATNVTTSLHRRIQIHP